MVWCLLGRWMEVDRPSGSLGIAGPGGRRTARPGGQPRAGTRRCWGTCRRTCFWLLSVELQSPQHMLPHLWRMPQWLAWGCYLVLAALAILDRPAAAEADPAATIECDDLPDALAAGPASPDRGAGGHPGRTRSGVVCHRGAASGAGDGLSAVPDGHGGARNRPGLRRRPARGPLADRADGCGRLRAILLAVAFTGDWLLVVVTVAELAVSATQSDSRGSLAPCVARLSMRSISWRSAMLALGLNFLGHHDTEYGHIPLLAALGLGVADRIDGRGVADATLRIRVAWQPDLDAGAACARRSALAWAAAAGLAARGGGAAGSCRVAASARAGPDRPLPVRGGPGRRHRAAGPLVPRPHARDRRGSSDRPAPRRSGSGRGGAWRSTGRRALITPTGWPTGSRDFRITSISTARPRSSCAPTWPIVTDSRRATRR